MNKSDRIAARPFVRWLERQSQLTRSELARKLGWGDEVGERRLYRYERSLMETRIDGEKVIVHTDTFVRSVVVDALSHAGVGMWELAGLTEADGSPCAGREEYEDDVVLEPDAFCETCHETVTPVDGACPWGEGHVLADAFGRERHYCEREDRMVYPANDGSCWRCGGTLTRGVPYQPCECGCGTQVRRFDRFGRGPAIWVRGHQPRSLEKDSYVNAEPFADLLRREIAAVDVLTAVASKYGLRREDVVALIEGVDQFSREKVRTGLWRAARYGQGKGAVPRPDAPGFFDLYPDDARSKVCPGCGEGKARHAEMCKACRKKAGGPRAKRERMLSEDLSRTAHVLYSTSGRSILQTAEALVERSTYASAESMAQALSHDWKERGWPLKSEAA